ncbi:DUF2509 family protein, partial [Mycobacterium tuberculosis]|nr:DUF2509 family protein [Mycobacterium tuberculosis]
MRRTERFVMVRRPARSTQEASSAAADASKSRRRIFGGGSRVLSSASGEVQVWQSGEVRGGQVRFSAHGWSDFCPLREASLC